MSYSNDLVAYVCRDELKGENLTLSITLNIIQGATLPVYVIYPTNLLILVTTLCDA